MQFSDVIPLLLISEGGYNNDSADPGGETKYGISKRSYPNEDIRGMTKERAAEIYRSDYWNLIQADKLPSWLRYTVFDFAVNAGVKRAVVGLQRLAGVKADGIVGPKTLEAAKTVSLEEYTNYRAAYYRDLVKERPRLKKFLDGWLYRTEKVAKQTHRLIA